MTVKDLINSLDTSNFFFINFYDITGQFINRIEITDLNVDHLANYEIDKFTCDDAVEINVHTLEKSTPKNDLYNELYSNGLIGSKPPEFVSLNDKKKLIDDIRKISCIFSSFTYNDGLDEDLSYIAVRACDLFGINYDPDD